ncbi:MAG: choice-of-anchor D domain-containing protein [Verrucomicrobiota bacterium]
MTLPIAMKNHSLLPLLKVLAAAFILVASAGHAAADAEIAVEQPLNSNINDNGSRDFGGVVLGSSSSLTFTIKNTGDADLTGVAVTKTGAAEIVLSGSPTATIAANGSTTFTVTFTPTARGVRNASIQIASNDANENPYNISLTGTGQAPEIAVEQPANNNINDNDSFAFGAVDLASGTLSISKTFTIENTGTAPLTGLVITKDGTNSAEFTVTGPAAATVAANASTTFTVVFTPTTAGSKTAAIHIANNDPDGNESPFDINLTGLATVPLIAIEKPAGTSLPNNGTAAFGNTSIGDVNDVTFTVKNAGGSPLALTSFNINGTDKRLFSMVGNLPTTLGPGLSAVFTVRFGPSTLGSFTANLTIGNNSATNPYTINLTGTGTANVNLEDAFGYKCTEIAGGNILPFLVSTDVGVLTEGSLTGIDKAVPLDIGFDFFFYEKSYSRCSISTTGLVTFGGSSVDYTPDAIPNAATPNEFIAPLWTDLEVTSTSKILYKTVGIAPDRIFVVKYENMKLYNNGGAATDKRVTFQVQLYETTNAIQVRYQDENPAIASPAQQLTIGIESRNYLGDPQPGVGAVGIQYKNGLFDNAGNRPFSSGTTAATSNKSILFTRPVVISMESKYQRPDFPAVFACTTTVNSKTVTCPSTAGFAASMGISGPNIPAGAEILSVTNSTTFQISINATASGSSSLTVSGSVSVGTLALGLNPTYGTIYQTPIGTVKRFEAPEHIYLDKNFNTLDSVGDVGDANPAWYRLVNDGYAIDGQVVQGTHAFFTVTLTRDVTVIWRWRLECAVIIDSATGQGGFGNPVPQVGRQWFKLGDQLAAAIDTSVENSNAGFRFHTTGYTLYDKFGTVLVNFAASDDTATRLIITPISLTDAVRLKWNFTGQVRYRFDAASGAGDSNQLNGQSFVRVYNPDGVTVDSVVFGSGANTDVWIDSGLNSGRKVDIGAFYRTGDRYFTLGDFAAPPGGDLGPIGSSIAALKDESIADQLFVPRAARIYTVDKAINPTEIHWQYPQTIFRAEVPLGSPVDPAQFVPALPDSAVLSDGGPSEGYLLPVGTAPTGAATGNPIRWDKVGKQLYPVHPGSNRIQWQDQNDTSKSYHVEVVSGYPGDAVTLVTAREIKSSLVSVDGKRQGTAPGYVFQASLGSVSTDFVAAPTAHYHHLYDPTADRRPPTKLDLSTTDEWALQDLTYSDITTDATVGNTAGKAFSAAGAGRSVVLFSYRPNSDEIADGNLAKEKLAVRVVESGPIAPILRNDPKLVLGQRGLELGGGPSSTSGAFGIIQRDGSSTTAVTLDNNFVVDFWLNAKSLQPSAAVTLTDGTTTSGSTTVTCASTAGIVSGMSVSGTNIPAGAKISSVSNATSLVISAAATGSETALTFTAFNKPVTILTTATGGLKVTLDTAVATVTATYHGMPVTHALPKAGAEWRHYAIHVFNHTFFGVGTTVVDFYLDGVRVEKGFVSSWFPGNTDSTVGTSVTSDSLRFGVDADPLSGLQLDQFRLFNLATDAAGPLGSGELRQLRTQRDMTLAGKQLRSISPSLWFSFEAAPVGNSFANLGTLAGVGVGPVAVDAPGVYSGVWANVDLQEVATGIASTLDNANFGGSGYILNNVSNYNPQLYSRSAEVGTWGPIFPVNHSQLFTEANKKLEVAYYENPYLVDPLTNPNVAWPYVTAEFKEVTYPALGPHKNKAIYISSRVGSEGVDQKGSPQKIYDLSKFADLQIYNQPDKSAAGYNPNEEHALVAASGRAALKVKNLGEALANNPPLSAFALQSEVNATGTIGYTSDPWVLVQVNNLVTGEPEMAAYQVFKTRTGSVAFPRPGNAAVTATPGLAYEPAENPEDRFLTLDAAKSFNFEYKFEYPVFAGDLLIPPYPLNLVIGNVSMQDERGGNIATSGVAQRTLWRDVNHHAWVASGGGSFFSKFFYPFRGDFYLPGTPAAGTPVAWLPTPKVFTGVGSTLEPVSVIYNSSWRSDYPKLKRGETLTYQGGEYFSETPGSKGLPALVAMKAAEVVYDSSTPSMLLKATGTSTTNESPLSKASARIIRALDRREQDFTTAQMAAAGFSPAATEILPIAERWYFKSLPGSLAKRFYFDSLAGKLVFRGRLNDKESGDSKLTSGPDPINILEPDVMTPDEFASIIALSSQQSWSDAIGNIYKLSQNPHGITAVSASVTAPVYLQGVKAQSGTFSSELKDFWTRSGTTFSKMTLPDPQLVHLDSFGVGSALVPSPSLITQSPTGSLYMTIAENNRSELDGAPVSLHIIEIIPDRYRGAIKVIEPSDAFSEKIALQHNGDFGANTDDLYYEWWIRDAGPLDVIASEILPNGSLAQTNPAGETLWQQYIPVNRAQLTDVNKQHRGLHTVIFEGRPDVVLADKLVMVRYRHKDEANWKLVPFEFADASKAWKPGNIPVTSPAPFQWAGAANSPQLQANGSKRYIPQLVMGWVKRVLDRINPYEARYTDFFSNESPATYSSQIQIAGAPYAGKVALNPDKNVIENTGLIELYETVLARAKELSIDNSSNPVSTVGINQALLLAATRLSVLYELLAREAYSDAQDSTITVTDDELQLANVASFTHAFENLEPDLLHEELSLLRGTDFRKSFPVYNRMFWNYAKGLGEAAYSVNYNIHDATSDGFINENDARALFPQGHGDSWGHFVSALTKHYDLLQAPNFSWKTRSELYSLMQNVLEVDFLDEKTFARLAAAKARAGRDIVRGTYRLNYTQDPSGQWQGYTDGADPARAWGVSEWAHRAGQGAYFDWAVANALLPEEAAAATPVTNPENLDRIERSAARDEVSEVAGGLFEIQIAMDEANGGVNPLGFDSDAITFDIDPKSPRSHFEQIYDRAVTAGSNALATLDFAAKVGNKIRYLENDTDALRIEAYRQDLDFRNRLIEIFGQPYTGTVGFGKVYPEGYQGPDTQLFAYLDRTKITDIIPVTDANAPESMVTFTSTFNRVPNLADDNNFVGLYANVYGNILQSLGNTVTKPLKVASGEFTSIKVFTFGAGATELTESFGSFLNNRTYEDFSSTNQQLTVPLRQTSPYAFQSGDTWGSRTSYGKLQTILEQDLRERIALETAIKEYQSFLQTFEIATNQVKNQIELSAIRGRNEAELAVLQKVHQKFFAAKDALLAATEKTKEAAEKISAALSESLPKNLPTGGLSISPGDALAPARGGIQSTSVVVQMASKVGAYLLQKAMDYAKFVLEQQMSDIENDVARMEDIKELNGLLVALNDMTGKEETLRNAIGTHLQQLEMNHQNFITAQSEGFRLLREREAFNKILAAKVQKNRYRDMVFRLSRNEAMTKYQSVYDNAAHYAWLAARAYDYETSLDPGHPAAPGQLLNKIVKERQLGLWSNGVPQTGQGGLAEILNQLNGNFQVLKGQLGINNPQAGFEKISLRKELFRIGKTASTGGTVASDERWKDALKARIVPDLNKMPEFVRFCRPFASTPGTPQPGIVIRFGTSIEPGLNLFGLPLIAGDHAYSTANFATKVQGFGTWLENYNSAGLSSTPRAYLVPVGNDYLRASSSNDTFTRLWSVQEQRIPTPFVINTANLTSPGFIPTLNGVDGGFSQLRRHGDFRMYHDNGGTATDGELTLDSRLTGRSVWNSEWLLIIPGSYLHVNPNTGLTTLADTVSDIKLYFKTYSHQGQ